MDDIQQLGFGGSPRPIRVFIGKEAGTLWYFWNSDKQIPIAINESSLTGYVRGLARRELVSDYGHAEKLIVFIEADRFYEIVCGFNTWFSKSLLLALSELNETELARTIVIEPVSNNNTKKVIFANVYNWKKDRVFSKWTWRNELGKPNEPNLNELIDRISGRTQKQIDSCLDDRNLDIPVDLLEVEEDSIISRKDEIPF